MPQKMDEDYHTETRLFQIALEEYDEELTVQLNRILKENQDQLRDLSVMFRSGGQEIHAVLFRSDFQASYLLYGSYFPSDFSASRPEAVIGEFISEDAYEIGDQVSILSGSYQVVGLSASERVEIPFITVPESEYTAIQSVDILLEEIPTGTQAAEWNTYFRGIFGENAAITNPQSRDLNIMNRNTLQAMMSGAVLLLAVVNLVYLFRYILIQRRSLLGVSMLCGCTQRQAQLLLLLELFLYNVCFFALCWVLFEVFFSDALLSYKDYHFPLDWRDYGFLFAVYFSVTLLVFLSTVRQYSRDTIRTLLAKG